jgi:hypothetical protein
MLTRDFAGQRRTTGLKRLVVKTCHIPTAAINEPDQPPTLDRLTVLLEAGPHEEMVVDLRIGMEFDKSAVKEKLAKTLAYVVLGDPSRLRTS